MENEVCTLFGTRFPLVQAGMVWCSGWELASAVSNAGGLGIIGAGSMNAEILKIHIDKARQATTFPFGVNVPLLYSHAAEIIDLVIKENIPIVFSSAGNPASYTQQLRDKGIKVVHVVSSVRFAEKAEKAGVNAIVAEGFEAGGHNGIEETTTIALIPAVRKSVSLPLIAAGGIATGRGMLAAMTLGADGVQIGTRFAASLESSAHPNFKERILQLKEGDTRLYLRKVGPVRMIRNSFAIEIENAENNGAGPEELLKLLGHGRSRKGIFEGELQEGVLEIGQISSIVNEIKTAGKIVEEIIEEYTRARKSLTNSKYSF
jgi:enoyl-[acyl-carrier protein] reductase II